MVNSMLPTKEYSGHYYLLYLLLAWAFWNKHTQFHIIFLRNEYFSCDSAETKLETPDDDNVKCLYKDKGIPVFPHLIIRNR